MEGWFTPLIECTYLIGTGGGVNRFSSLALGHRALVLRESHIFTDVFRAAVLRACAAD